jgi:hypothetical protein
MKQQSIKEMSYLMNASPKLNLETQDQQQEQNTKGHKSGPQMGR